jgi:integrase
MSNITAAKRERKNITTKMCEAKVAKQTKTYDLKERGFYVSVSPSGVATFNLKYTDRNTHRRGSIKVGVYHRETFDVERARNEARHLKWRIANGEDVAQTARQARRLHTTLSGMTVSELIDLRIAWISEEIEVRRHTEDGVIIKRKPRMKDCANMTSHLNRFVRPRLGPMIAREVCNDDIATLQTDIIEGKLIIKKGRTSKKGSISSARHMRKAVSGLFNWAAEAGRKYVSASPCVNLPPLPEEEPRKRKLSPDEIRVLWRGLDRDDLPVDRKICLAIKFALVSMLRSVEMLHIHRDELERHDLNSRFPLVVIPEERVKAGHEIHQPLSDLAVEIAREAMGNYPWMFAGRWGTEPMNRKAMAAALRGRKEKVKGKMVVKSIGICALLGLKPFTPHDLRRTAASLMGQLKVPRSIISLCLDHTIKSDEHGEVALVTGKHYDQDPRIEEKREALQKLADEIRRIVGEPVEAQTADTAMRRAA